MQSRLKKAIFVPLLLAGALSITPFFSVHAQRSDNDDSDSATQISERDFDTFGAYLESNPSTARLLYENPDLINDRRFVRKHESLRQWLEDNPRIARKIEDNPEAFLRRPDEENRGRARASTATQISSQDVASFEAYLNSDWETAQLLYRDPDLIKDRRFIRDHPDLRDWLDDHRSAAVAIQANPHKFLWRERTVGPQDFLNQLLRGGGR